MLEWWNELGGVNQGFYIAALFFSVIFTWQFIAAMIGLGGGEADVEVDVGADVDVDVDVDVDGLDVDDIEAHSMADAAETMAAFRVFSIRAVLAFCTMFSWAGAMYLNMGKPIDIALLLATAWGLGGWALVAVLLNWLRKLAETGTQKLATCLGRAGTVYLNIPAGGRGEVRVLVSGRVTLVKARATGDAAMSAGMAVRVRRVIDATTVEVEPVEANRSDSGDPQGKDTD